jgi:hypothetical protein
MRGLVGDQLGIRTHQDSILARLGEAPALNDIARSMPLDDGVSVPALT